MHRMLSLACLAALVPLPGTAQDAPAGQALYRSYCATCHGVDAGGNGPMAELLAVNPPDLRALARDNDGTFPLYRVATRIDGRDPLLAHGGPMPLFGDAFDGESAALRTDAGQPLLTSRPIADLLAWLMTVQQ